MLFFIVILPHIGSSTVQTRHQMIAMTEMNIFNALINQPMINELK